MISSRASNNSRDKTRISQQVERHYPAGLVDEAPEESKIDNLESTLKRPKIKAGLDHALQDRILVTCDYKREWELAIHKPSPTLQGVCVDLRNSTKTRKPLEGQGRHIMAVATVATTSMIQIDAQISSATDSPTMDDNPLLTKTMSTGK
ncbi:hypothetical protein BGT96224_A20542 [Blumeria graminis f. sp. tritici 96224]|nr:hypothetical protein BGT96224_A20542 [Blumeria graminis f. sp. tritici 96224]